MRNIWEAGSSDDLKVVWPSCSFFTRIKGWSKNGNGPGALSMELLAIIEAKQVDNHLASLVIERVCRFFKRWHGDGCLKCYKSLGIFSILP